LYGKGHNPLHWDGSLEVVFGVFQRSQTLTAVGLQSLLPIEELHIKNSPDNISR